MKRLWYQYDLSFPADGKWLTAYATRYCGFRGKDPVETLKLIPIKVLHNFLHWILQERSETLRTASSLQTYWNTFCLVRKKETGYHLTDPLVKSQMHGVRRRDHGETSGPVLDAKSSVGAAASSPGVPIED